jgi:Circularly permutated YpsA SLOG family
MQKDVPMAALEKIVSGGQTGVDRGALDAALAAHFPAGGWCPADRSAEDGVIPSQYPVTPLEHGGYRERTLQNVLDSDATAIFAPGGLTGGTRVTLMFCRRHGKPMIVIDASQTAESDAAMQIARFVGHHSVRTLNVAGPRASGWPQAHEYAERTIGALIALLR